MPKWRLLNGDVQIPLIPQLLLACQNPWLRFFGRDLLPLALNINTVDICIGASYISSLYSLWGEISTFMV